MKGSKNNIANRKKVPAWAIEKCVTCHAPFKPLMVISKGKARMIKKSCDCNNS